jgi:hypothetical protein
MKTQSPAVTPADLASAAGRKTAKVQRKLHEAQSELKTANSILVKAVPERSRRDLDQAVEQNVAAEAKVHEAADELEVVKELLDHAGGVVTGAESGAKGRTGQGLQSLIPHLGKGNRA